VEIGTEAAAQFPEKEYMNGIFVAVRMLFSPHGTRIKRPVFYGCLPFLLLSFSSLCEAIEACLNKYRQGGGSELILRLRFRLTGRQAGM
jgi:hypothetical protein